MKLPKVETDEMEILTKNECAVLLNKLEGNWLHPIVTVAMTTGMRLGEVLAIRWKNVNLEKGWVQIVQSVEEIKGNRRLKDVKTANGRRKILFPPYTVNILRQRKAAQAEMQLKLGAGKADLVFTNFDGTMRSPHLVSTEFPKVVKRLGITPIKFHGLRHTHISHLLEDGHPIKAVSSRAGHAQVSVTLDIYTHCLLDSQETMITAYGNGLETALEHEKNKG